MIEKLLIPSEVEAISGGQFRRFLFWIQIFSIFWVMFRQPAKTHGWILTGFPMQIWHCSSIDRSMTSPHFSLVFPSQCRLSPSYPEGPIDRGTQSPRLRERKDLSLSQGHAKCAAFIQGRAYTLLHISVVFRGHETLDGVISNVNVG